jgi:hypothetical protein
MTTKADFNAEAWSTIVEAPLLAGLRVVAAGRGGTIRESVAIGRVYAEARQAHGESQLLDELVASPPAVDPQRIGAGTDLRSAARERLGEAARKGGGKTRAELYAEARRRDLPGRSRMSKSELERALR